MATVSEIWVRVNADVKGLQSGLLKGGTELKAFSATANKSAAESTAAGSKIGGAFSSVSSTLNRLAPAFIAIGAVALGAIVKGISATTQWATEVRSLQRVTGQTAESASALAGAGKILGLSVTQLATGFGALSKNIVNGSAGLTKYGIATRDASGQTLPFDAVLGNVIDKFQTLKPGIDQAAFAQNVFGKSGKALIPILAQGRAGLAALEQKAADLHLVMSQKNLDDAKKLSLAEHELGAAFEGASISIGQAFIPATTVLVHALTAVTTAVARIPTPVKVAVLGFSLLTGAIAATAKIGGFFKDTWEKVLNAVSNTAQIDSAAQGAGSLADNFGQVSQELANFANIVTAVRGSTIAATAPIAAMGLAVGSEADAALAAQLANTKFAASESGLIVPTEALAAANADLAASQTAAAVGSTALRTRLAGLFGLLKGVATPLLGGFIIGSIPELPKTGDLQKIDTLLGTLQKDITDAGGASKLTGEQTAFLTQETQFATSALGANALAFAFALKNGVSYEEALTRITTRQGGIAASTTGLLAALRNTFAGIEDGSVKVADLTGAMALFSGALDPVGRQLDDLSKISGQDFSSIRTDLLKALSTATIQQIPAVFGAALAQVKTQVKAWHDSIVQNFGGAEAALSSFLGQAAGKGPKKVSFDNLTSSLAKTQTQLHRWSSDFSTILRSSGDKASKFLQDMSANGLQSIGILDVVAQQPKKIRDQFLTQYNQVNKATDTIATQITTAFGKGIDRVVTSIDRIYNAIAKVLGLPPIKLKADTSQASRGIAGLINALKGLHDKDITVRYHQVGSVFHPLPFHSGGLVFHEGGAVAASAEVLRHAKRMHVGGLGSDEIPAVLQRGEFVVRRQAVQHLGLPTMHRINRMHAGGAATTADETATTSSYGVRPPPTRNGQMWMEWAAGVANALPSRAIAWWNNRLNGIFVRHHAEPTMQVTANLGPFRSQKYLGYTDFDLRHIRLNPIIKTVFDPAWNRVLRHEMGHGFGLGHVQIATNLMDRNLTGDHINSTQVQQIKKWFRPSTLHGGGLASDEIPAVLQRGEFVIRRHAVERIGVPKLRELNRMHEGGQVAPIAKHIIERLTSAERFHEGGTVQRLRTSVSSQLLRDSRFHTGGLTERFRTERFHDGGMTIVQPPTSQAPSEGIEEALRRAIRAEMAGAVAKGVKEVREKLYVDRRRFGRDLDQNVLTDGHW